MSRKFPVLKVLREAEEFVDQDLSEYIVADNFKAFFEYRPKQKLINLRISEELVEALRSAARRLGISLSVIYSTGP